MEGSITEQAEVYVKAWFEDKMPQDLHYHNFAHTAEVVKNSGLIAEKAGMSASETEELALAAWFHDTGFAFARKGHEAESARIAAEFLAEKAFPEERIETVKKTIMATQMGMEAESLAEKIIQDADMSHLGTKKYLKRLKKLRKEWAKDQGQNFSDLEWYSMNLDFLENHQFHTKEAEELFGAKKKENVEKAIQHLKEAEEQPETETPAMEEQTEKPPKKKKAGSDRGIETMFRITMKNHIQLSQIADNKANIMLSINSIIISIILSILVPQIEDRPALLIPTLIMLLSSVLSVVLATVSTIPKVNRGNITREQVEKKQANLLFFGNFNNMNLTDFTWGMNYMMEERDYLYGSMIKDLYFLGKVLHRKYTFLRLTYATFMFGTVISVIAFMVALSLEI